MRYVLLGLSGVVAGGALAFVGLVLAIMFQELIRDKGVAIWS